MSYSSLAPSVDSSLLGCREGETENRHHLMRRRVAGSMKVCIDERVPRLEKQLALETMFTSKWEGNILRRFGYDGLVCVG